MPSTIPDISEFDLPQAQDISNFDLPKPQKRNKSLIADAVTATKIGVERLPSIATGILDIAASPIAAATGVSKPVDKATNWLGEKTGFQPSKWADKAAAEEYSPATREALDAVDKAEGFLPTLGTYIDKPRAIVPAAFESLASTVAGGVAGRLAMPLVSGGAAKLATTRAAAAGEGVAADAAKKQLLKSGAIAGGIGEGVTAAGQSMSQISEDVDPLRAAGASLGAGAGTALLGAAGGRLAAKAGLVTPEAAIAAGTFGGGVKGATTKTGAALNYGKRIGGGAIAEGVFEEMPQSAQEQAWQNFAEGRPLDEGVGKAAAQGLVAGAAMGGAFNAMPRGKGPETNQERILREVSERGPGQPIDKAALDQWASGYAQPPAPPAPPAPSQGPSGSFSDMNEFADFIGSERADLEQRRQALKPAGPLSAAVQLGTQTGAVQQGIASVPPAPVLRERDFIGQPSGSFSGMDELATLIGSERADVEARRQNIAQTQQLRKETELLDADTRVADQRAKESAKARDALLSNVLDNLPADRNPHRAWDLALQKAGYTDKTFTPAEVAKIQAWKELVKKPVEQAKPEAAATYSAPNELDPAALGIKERKPKVRQPQKIAEVQPAAAPGPQTVAPPAVPAAPKPAPTFVGGAQPKTGGVLAQMPAAMPLPETGKVADVQAAPATVAENATVAPTAKTKPQSVGDATRAESDGAAARDGAGLVREERDAQARTDKVAAWKAKHAGKRFETIAARDIAASDHENLAGVVRSGKVTAERAVEMIDDAAASGVLDAKVAGYMKQKVAQPPAAPAQSTNAAADAQAVKGEGKEAAGGAQEADDGEGWMSLDEFIKRPAGLSERRARIRWASMVADAIAEGRGAPPEIVAELLEKMPQFAPDAIASRDVLMERHKKSIDDAIEMGILRLKDEHAALAKTLDYKRVRTSQEKYNEVRDKLYGLMRQIEALEQERRDRARGDFANAQGAEDYLVRRLTNANGVSEEAARKRIARPAVANEKAATHKDPGQPAEAATAPVVEQAVKKSARNTDMSIKEAREWLLGEIDKAIVAAGKQDAELKALLDREKAARFDVRSARNAQEGAEAAAAFEVAKAARIEAVRQKIGYVEFDVPGDGKFKVLNAVDNLTAFRDQVKKSPGFSANPSRPMRPGNGMAGGPSLEESIAAAKKDGGDGLAEIGNEIELARLRNKDDAALQKQFKSESGGKSYDDWRAEQEAQESAPRERKAAPEPQTQPADTPAPAEAPAPAPAAEQKPADKPANPDQDQVELAKVPPQVQNRINYGLKGLRDVERRLNDVIRARGRGQILALELKEVQDDIAKYRRPLNAFRRGAEEKGVDAEAAIRALGGEPDFAQFGEKTADDKPATNQPAPATNQPAPAVDQAAPATPRPQDADEAAKSAGLNPADVQWKAGKGLAQGRWMAAIDGVSGGMETTPQAAATSLAQRLDDEKRKQSAEAARKELSLSVADKIKRGEQPTDAELEELFGLKPGQRYVKQSWVGDWAVEYLGVPRNGIRKAMGVAAGTVTSDSGVNYPVVYPRKLHKAFGPDASAPQLYRPAVADFFASLPSNHATADEVAEALAKTNFSPADKAAIQRVEAEWAGIVAYLETTNPPKVKIEC